MEYNIVKNCGLCKVRFVVPKAEKRRRFCNICQKKVDKSKKEEEENEDE